MQRNAHTMLQWFNGVLRQYERELSIHSIEPPHNTLWEEMQSGVRIFCVLLHHLGQGVAFWQGGVTAG